MQSAPRPTTRIGGRGFARTSRIKAFNESSTKPVIVKINPNTTGAAAIPDLYSINKGVHPDTWSLPELLQQLKDTSAVSEVLNYFFQTLELNSAIRVKIEPAIQSLNPNLVTNQLAIDLKTFDAGRSVLLERLKSKKNAGTATTPAERGYLLPANFNLKELDQVVLAPNPPWLEEIYPGVFRGYPHNTDLSDQERRRNTVLAEVLERLSANPDQKNGSPSDQTVFTVLYNGLAYTDLDAFLSALAKNGHKIRASVRTAVADFAGLWGKDAQGNLHPVAAPGFLRTGFKDRSGHEAILPAFHSELIFKVNPQSDTSGQLVSFNVVFFQGSSKTGFSCGNCNKRPAWVGESTREEFYDDKAWKALALSGRYINLARAIAADLFLPAEGYGVTGVCNDSVGIIQTAVLGKTSIYGLLRKNQFLLAEIEKRLSSSASTAKDMEAYKSLKNAVMSTPNDISSPGDAASRALVSIPWGPNQATFPIVEKARSILESQ